MWLKSIFYIERFDANKYLFVVGNDGGDSGNGCLDKDTSGTAHFERSGTKYTHIYTSIANKHITIWISNEFNV